MRAWASRYARLVLDRCKDNKREACRVLDISYHTLQSYLRFPVHEPADPRSDLYSLGIVAYELLTGELPYTGETPMAIAYQHLSDRVPAPSSSAPGTGGPGRPATVTTDPAGS